MKRMFRFGPVVLAAVILLIQFIPFGHDHLNPAPVSEPPWSNPGARALVKEHCFQCHSNETAWPWYSSIAPASWLIRYDVSAARSKFNFSDWNANPGELSEMEQAVRQGSMPPLQYWIFHPASHLNDQQKQDLILALEGSIR